MPSAAPPPSDDFTLPTNRRLETAALWFAATVLPLLAVGLAVLLVTHVDASDGPVTAPPVAAASAPGSRSLPAPPPAAPAPAAAAASAHPTPATVVEAPAAPAPHRASAPTHRDHSTLRARRAASDPIVAHARALERAGDLAGAEAAYARAFRVCDENPHAAAGLAALYLGRHDPGRALMWAKRAVRLRRHRSGYFVLEGDALALAGRLTAAREAYARALALDPSNARARVRLDGLAGPSGGADEAP